MRFVLYIAFLQLIVFSLLPDLLIAGSVLSDSLLSGDSRSPKKAGLYLPFLVKIIPFIQIIL